MFDEMDDQHEVQEVIYIILMNLVDFNISHDPLLFWFCLPAVFHN